MYRKVISYTDYDGNACQDECLFNLSKAELMEMNFSAEGGMHKMLERIVKTNDTNKIIAVFKEIILKAYGEKSDDGKRFIKYDRDGHRLADDFAQTEAYSELFMELATDEAAATDFINGVIPKAMADEIATRS